MGAGGRPGQEIQQPVVVVIEELRGDRWPCTARRGCGHESTVAVAEREASAIGPREEEVREAVLVDVCSSDGCSLTVGSGRLREADVRGNVAKGAVAHVLKQHRRSGVVDHHEIDVAAVVVVGWHDGDGVSIRLQVCRPRLVRERALAAVAEQAQRWRREVGGEGEWSTRGACGGGREIGQAGNHQIEIAVVIHVRERCCRGQEGVRPNPR